MYSNCGMLGSCVEVFHHSTDQYVDVFLQQGILDKYNVELIGAKLPSIDKAEDRELFKQVGLFSSFSSCLHFCNDCPTPLLLCAQQCRRCGHLASLV